MLSSRIAEVNKMKSSNCILILFLLLFFNTAKSTTWITIENGNWSDSSIWLSGIAPNYSIADTIIIKDTIAFDEDIYLNTGALMQIDSNGGAFCGHHNITVYSGAKLNKYGALNLDALFIKGGIADFILPGPFLMWLTKVTDGGSIHISTYSESCICVWDTCFISIPFAIPPENPSIDNQYVLFPNPSNGNFNLQYSQASESIFYFYSVLGQKIFSSTLEGTSDLKNFLNNNLSNGMYYWQVVSGNTVYQKGKYLIVK